MAHGDGWLQKQKSGIWYAIWWVDGARHRRSTRTRDRNLAERELERFRGVSRETRNRDGGPVLSDAFSALAAHWRNQGKASLKSLRYWEKSPKRLLGDCTPIGELSAGRIDRDYTTPRIAEGVSRNTVRVELAAISSALKLALGSEAPKLRRPPEDFSVSGRGFFHPPSWSALPRISPTGLPTSFAFCSGPGGDLSRRDTCAGAISTTRRGRYDSGGRRKRSTPGRSRYREGSQRFSIGPDPDASPALIWCSIGTEACRSRTFASGSTPQQTEPGFRGFARTTCGAAS